MAGAFLLFFSIQTYGAMVAQGVVEEKASRVVEIVLSSVRPWQLLLGKVLGLGAVGLLQLVVLGGAGLAVAGAAGVLTAGAGLVPTLVSVVVWYLLGFALYATVFAALGSLVSRQEDTQSVLSPVTIVVLLGFVVGFNLLTSDPRGTAITVLSLLPPFSPLFMPARIALGVAPAGQVVLAFALTIAFTAVVLALGGRIYANSVLRTGARVSLREALCRRR
jgi:ABC-2 type transport system permease protein